MADLTVEHRAQMAPWRKGSPVLIAAVLAGEFLRQVRRDQLAELREDEYGSLVELGHLMFFLSVWLPKGIWFKPAIFSKKRHVYGMAVDKNLVLHSEMSHN
jgi:hypothetical protein